ncbi:MAG: hypothetical protein R3345_07740 [Fulvivirga sp.]|nr:hypothetical protein [Fulvivirga sp.]
MEQFIDIALWVAMGMVAVAALLSIVMPIINSLSHPKTLIKSAVGIVILGVIFLICWSIAGDEVSKRFLEEGMTASTSKLAGGLLMTMYVLFIAAIVGIVFSEINKAFK